MGQVTATWNRMGVRVEMGAGSLRLDDTTQRFWRQKNPRGVPRCGGVVTVGAPELGKAQPIRGELCGPLPFLYREAT